MTRVFQSLDFFVLSCVFLTVGSAQILPPQNLTLRWIDAFIPELSWAPPPHSVENCTYIYSVLTKNHVPNKQNEARSPWSEYLIDKNDDEIYWYSLQTVCNGNSSAPSVVRLSDSGLVTNVQCAILSPERSHCSWSTTSYISDLGFFYRQRMGTSIFETVLRSEANLNCNIIPPGNCSTSKLRYEDGRTPSANDVIPPLQTCSSYSYTGGNRTGCDLQANITQVIHILLNGTLNNKTVRRTFIRDLVVTPPPLNWTVDKNENKFYISWIPPNIGQLHDWDFNITYTECDQIKEIRTGGTSTELELVSHCQYCMSIKAEGKSNKRTAGGGTPWTDNKCFDAETDPYSLVYVAIVIPLMFAALAVLTFVFCRKNKDSIFPKVPEPRDFLSDISDNNNKGNVRNLYIPAEEEEACKITLVIDPQNNKHDF